MDHWNPYKKNSRIRVDQAKATMANTNWISTVLGLKQVSSATVSRAEWTIRPTLLDGSGQCIGLKELKGQEIDFESLSGKDSVLFGFYYKQVKINDGGYQKINGLDYNEGELFRVSVDFAEGAIAFRSGDRPYVVVHRDPAIKTATFCLHGMLGY